MNADVLHTDNVKGLSGVSAERAGTGGFRAEVAEYHGGGGGMSRDGWNGLQGPWPSDSADKAEHSPEAVSVWFTRHLAHALGTHPEAIDQHVALIGLGADSATAASLLAEIEERYDVAVDLAEVIEEEMSVATICARLCERLASTEGS